MNEKVIRTLRAARALITPPDRWIKNAAAHTKDGKSVNVRTEGAYSFCALGALAHVISFEEFANRSWEDPDLDYLGRGFGLADKTYIAPMNDKSTHEEVLAAFDRAIALAEEDYAGAPLPPVETPTETPPLVTF